MYLPGKASESFFWSVLNFFAPLLHGALWDGCDEMEYRKGDLSYVCTITFI